MFFSHLAENDHIQEIYWRAEQKNHKYVRIIIISFLMYDQIFYVLSFIYSIYYCCIGNYDTSTWPALLEVNVPFDTNAIYGWYLKLFTLMSVDIAFLTAYFLTSTQFIGSCIYVAAICEHFDSIMQTIQTNVERNRRDTNPRKYEMANMEIIAKYREAIQIHVQINE